MGVPYKKVRLLLVLISFILETQKCVLGHISWSFLSHKFLSHGVKMTHLIHFFVLIATPFGCMMAHALVENRACSPTVRIAD